MEDGFENYRRGNEITTVAEGAKGLTEYLVLSQDRLA